MKLERIAWSDAVAPREADLHERLDADGFEAFVWRDEPGADYAPHAHDHDESLWVIEGEIVFGAEGGRSASAPATASCCRRERCTPRAPAPRVRAT